ncbi:N-terminal binuclear Zn cluster-containing protein [Trichoderma citrinoviride]|uniref:N-terminal binuclear Zn cluster-containing protein n=1 Tax=Trichoderma citrinoviride TaxID=58853 RepID=A0A2T4BLR0_9HYPO|nr:N-terminal binuclear Zn cluster-containing protein [Trichoderma citrinoviride]PTB70258.1 N-terminal binuclear Zn cluster-containing protein [Trichoderma citrinoviride]
MQNLAPSAATDARALRKACDQCRQRKIRCDKNDPCSNCVTAERRCTSTAWQRPKELRQRVLISSQYEKKIDRIEARLANIENLLKNLSSSTPTDPSRFIHTPQTDSAVPTGTSNADYDSSDEESVLGGDSGLTVHTTFASEFLERAVQRAPLPAVNPKMETALANLSQLVELQKHRSISHGPRFPLQQPVPPGGVSKLPMPPMATVVALLKHVKAAPPTFFTILCTLVGIKDFADLCRTVYFPAEDFSDATFAMVNAMLYNLFVEQHSLTKDEALREEYNSYVAICKTNLETTLANFPLFLSPKIENVQALLLGCLYAIDVSRPSVAWHLITMAAWLCQAGGYHRTEVLRNDPPQIAQQKKVVFWHVYTLDKGLGLRLGRASVIAECDIDIKREFEVNGFDHLTSTTFPTLWVEISSLQSRIYEQLYSPVALASPQADLIQRARALATECSRLEVETDETREKVYTLLKSIGTSDVVDVFIKGDEVQFYVTKTLIYRVIPAPEGSITRFCDECLDAARHAMRTHQECVRFMDISTYMRSMYIHWNLLLTPFAPFFVLFCYVIETSSLVDLKVLQTFVDSLEGARGLSEPIDKLYRLCRVMCDIATFYVEAKGQQLQSDNSISIGDEFEMYLSQLGFIPSDDQAMANTDTTEAGAPIQGSGQVAQLADWFVGSRNMIGLLEEDLSQIDSHIWMKPDDEL